MKNSGYSEILKNITERIYLFETPQEVDEFLKEAVSLLMKEAGASVGAVFVRDEAAQELVFRVGFDEEGFWDRLSCGCEQASLRFPYSGNDLGKTFSEGAIRFLSYDENDEEQPLKSKLLVPIKRGPERTGIFLMAHKKPDAFNQIDRRDIMQAASLLGDMLAEATALINGGPEDGIETATLPRSIKGLKTSDGYVEGKALPIWADVNSAAEQIPPQGSISDEETLFDGALSLSLQQLDEMQKSATIDSEIVSLIFTAQFYMLKDESLSGKIKALIHEGESAPCAVRRVIDEYAGRFARMPEIRFAEKAQDVRDLGFRLITNMGRPQEDGFSYRGQIVLSRHIYPSDLFRLAVEKVAGLVLRGTGVTAHISILARSLNLPVLITDDRSLLSIPEGTPLLLDATGGRLYINPDERTRTDIRDKREYKKPQRNYFTLRGASSDGVHIQVAANVNLYNDAKIAGAQGAEGIGLYRSEFPFILKKDFLSEEQQFRIYRSIFDTQNGKPVIMRTTDIGGDKLMQGRSEAESNPFLGVRGIRFSLANREMFRDQLKAMLRAGAGKDLGIMLPMVSDVEEVLIAREELELCMEQLERRGVEYNSKPGLGAMVELPSAAMSVEELASETDFLSIGTNDLTMYLLAVDRTNEHLSHLYRSHHPSVLKVLSQIAVDAGDKISELSVCGDAASDPVLIPFFAGLGIRKLSVLPSRVEEVKRTLSSYSIGEMEDIAKEMLSIRRLSAMEEYIGNFNA